MSDVDPSAPVLRFAVDGAVALITVDRPGRLNAIGSDTVGLFNAALDAVEAGEPEALVDEVSRQAKAGLSDDHRLLYPQIALEFAELFATTPDLAAAAAGSRSQED